MLAKWLNHPSRPGTPRKNGWKSKRLHNSCHLEGLNVPGGGGRKTIHPGRQRFHLVGGGHVSRFKKKHPKLKKFTVWWSIVGTAVGVEKINVSGES